MLSFNKSNDKTVASIDNLNNSSADDDGTASAIGHSDPNPKNDHNSVETISSDTTDQVIVSAKTEPSIIITCWKKAMKSEQQLLLLRKLKKLKVGTKKVVVSCCVIFALLSLVLFFDF